MRTTEAREDVVVVVGKEGEVVVEVQVVEVDVVAEVRQRVQQLHLQNRN